MMQKPLVSVLLPVFNAEHFLEETIKSIFDQSFQKFELIIINDGSTDNTHLIVNSFNDKRIIYLNNCENKGIVFCLNQGLKTASCNFIARIDGDDICHPERIEKQYNFLLKNPNISVVGSWIRVIDEKSRFIENWKLSKTCLDFNFNIYFKGNPKIAHPAVMFRADIIKKVGNYDIELNMSGVEDSDLWFRLIANGYKICNLPEYLLSYRVHLNQVSKKKSDFGEKMYLRAYLMLLESKLKNVEDINVAKFILGNSINGTFIKLKTLKLYFKLLPIVLKLEESIINKIITIFKFFILILSLTYNKSKI